MKEQGCPFLSRAYIAVQDLCTLSNDPEFSAFTSKGEGTSMKSKRGIFSGILILLGSLLSISWLAALSDDALVYVINIRNEIGNGLRVYIDNGIRQAEETDADAMIFDVHTPGGAVGAARDIIDAIQRTDIPTIAYVNTEAISAGAMISLSCDQIVMRHGGTIGDSAPVTIQGDELNEKAVSYIRGKIRATAERQGRNPAIAAAMVDKRLYLVRLAEGEIITLRHEQYNERKEAGEEMEIIASGGPEGELLTLTTEEALRYNLADGEADTIEDLLAMYQIVEVDGERKALTMETVVEKQAELGDDSVKTIKSLENATIQEVILTLMDRFVLFITSPVISAMLLAFGGIGLWVEIQTPGFGFPGIAGLICLALVFGGHRLLNIGVDYAILAFIVGVALLLLEFFVIPGFGIAGIFGIVLMLGSVFFVFKNAYALSTAITSLSISILTMFLVGIVLAYILPKTRTWSNFILDTAMDSAMGYHSAGEEDFQSYLGKTGVAITPLRPAGTVRVGDKRLDVVTVGDFIASETSVKIVNVEGSKIFVEAIDEAAS
jgi:membrane-bound serine protease (ClpP class)